MPFFQHPVEQKYLRELGNGVVTKAYNKFKNYFHDPRVQQNIRDAKEEQFQQKFLIELFDKILGYTINPDPDYNLTTEYKNEQGAKKADGAILQDGRAIAVIELKGTGTADLDKINEQAFNYKNNQTGCTYVITSNFEKLRFFIDNAVDHIEFNLFTLTEEQFKTLWLCLRKENIFSGIPLQIKQESLVAEDKITKQLYDDYALFKRELWDDMVKRNKDYDQLLLFKKTQKLLDRFLFIFFSEDKGLLPPNSINEIIVQWRKLKELDEERPLYERYKKYFGYMNDGFKGKKYEIHAYNGGLFKQDEVLDNIQIGDKVLEKHTQVLAKYDFDSEIDVNILGHIFEHSLSEIENVKAALEGIEVDKSKTKRKKEGVFYTPKYITKYIVDNTLGKLCKEKKAELDITDEAYEQTKKRSRKRIANLEAYREWLLNITICDPACGSGAFLNRALEFLIQEHQYIEDLSAKYHGTPMGLAHVTAHILENNLYGVDINEESVEIAKLSLWLRTAQKGRKLTALSNNIKCGNSLIDDPAVAGDKAFDWHKAFPQIFKERGKEKSTFHITTATHDSRTSQRMIDYKVRKKRDNGTRPYPEAIWLEPENELLITQTLAGITKEDNLDVLAFNVCGDHIHLLLVCEEEEVPKIMQKIKAVTAKEYNRFVGKMAAPPATTRERALLSKKKSNTTREHAPLSKAETEKYIPLWTQKFGCKKIKDEDQLWNTLEYIQSNRKKHELPPHNKKLQSIIDSICCEYDQAFRHEYKDGLPAGAFSSSETKVKEEAKAGFDVVIGNPPYLRVQGLRENFEKESVYYEKSYTGATGRFDIYVLFIERAYGLIASAGKVGFILPHKFMVSDFGEGIRKFLSDNKAVESVVNFGSEMVFADASTYTN